jgi:hypothetical protein
VKRPGLEAYVLAIERHLSRQRGTEHVLSPRDFALAKAWHAAALPLAAVLAGIDRAAERDAGVASLLRCRRLVEGLAAATPAEPAAGAESAPEDFSQRLEALQAAIAAARQPVAFEQAARRLAELLDLTAVAREPNWDYLLRKLEELDEIVDAAALEALEPREREALRADASSALRAQKLRGRAAALEDARLRYVKRRARERFALPRVATG